MAISLIGSSVTELEPAHSGSSRAPLGPPERIGLAVAVLDQDHSVTQLAREHGVSRKYVYEQARTAREALEQTFAPPPPPDTPVLFQLPVTWAWVRQLTLALTLVCHSPFRGVVELLRDHFGVDISVGSVHNIVQEAIEAARRLNAQEDLSGIRVGAHDEIFQQGEPVLVGADVRSTYCYLLSLEEHRDAVTWGVRLLELEARGLHPDSTIADGGTGLRAGQELGWPGVSCDADVFHALRDVGQTASYLDNRALGVLSMRYSLDQKMARAKRHGRGAEFSKKLALARQEEARAVLLADDVRILADWLQHDILSVAGPDYGTRCMLFDFVVAELRAREHLCPHRIAPVRTLLEHQRNGLLAFARRLEERIAAVAVEWHVHPEAVRGMLSLQADDPRTREHWRREAKIRGQVGERFHGLQEAVEEVADGVVRASSVIENINSRLRTYFFLRRHLGPGYLDLLRFFLNHRRFVRSERPEREGRSPAELLTGKTHPHWMELIGLRCALRN